MVDLAEYVNVIPEPKRASAPKDGVSTEPATDRSAAAETGNLGALRPCGCRKKGCPSQENEAPQNKTLIAECPSEDGAPRGDREKACCRHSFHFSVVVGDRKSTRLNSSHLGISYA